jgi:hypothetical protein
MRFTVKAAEMVNGVDLSHCVEGDTIEVAARDAALLIAGGPAARVENFSCSS